MTKRTVFSGIQPTGSLHIGNYLGALRNWVDLQNDYDTIYCVVDMHATTVPYDPQELHQSRVLTAKLLMAVGVDPSRSLLYFQSQVPQHAELSWILGSMTPLGALNRMTQYKEKAERAGQMLGLYSYPVLMAADIMVHKAHAVPVGDDQTQHLELTRDLAERFNNRYGDVLVLPEPYILEEVAAVPGTDGNKMSKSYQNTIEMFAAKHRDPWTATAAAVLLTKLRRLKGRTSWAYRLAHIAPYIPGNWPRNSANG